MSILVLNSSNYNYTPLNVWLKGLEEEVVCLTPEGHLNSYTENIKESNYYFVSIQNWYDRWELENKAIELNKKYKFKKVLSFREYDMIRAGDLRDILGISGQGKKAAQSFREKDLMKSIVMNNGLKSPKFSNLESFSDLNNFISDYGFPVIIKPKDGAGSVNTRKISNQLELDELLLNHDISNYLIEEFIDGEMYHVDGMVIDNKVCLAIPSKYINGCLDFQKGKSTASILLENRNQYFKKLIDYSKEIIKIFPDSGNFTFHLEVFIKDGEFIFCEIASRTGGGMIPETIEMKYGIHITKEVAKAEVGLSEFKDYEDFFVGKESTKLFGWILSSPLHGVLESVPEEIPFDWVVHHHQFAKIGSEFSGSKSSVFSIAAFICEGSETSTLVKKIEYLDEWFKDNCTYSEVIN